MSESESESQSALVLELVMVSLRASDLTWARRLALGLGPGVTVVAPPALVEAVRAEARDALAAYPGA